MTDLKKYGLNERFEQEATMQVGLFLARVTEQHRDLYKVICENGELSQKRFDSYQKLQREVIYDGLNSRQIENEKLISWFVSKNEMKQFKRSLKKR